MPYLMKIRPLRVFGAKSRPGRLQNAAARLLGNPFGAFLVESCVPRANFGPQHPTSVKARTLGPRSAQDSSKNDIWMGVRKKHEKWMKHLYKNVWFLMARNQVWRHTLRLFHTFDLFEKKKKRKSMPEGKPKVIVSAGRWPPHPWGKQANQV